MAGSNTSSKGTSIALGIPEKISFFAYGWTSTTSVGITSTADGWGWTSTLVVSSINILSTSSSVKANTLGFTECFNLNSSTNILKSFGKSLSNLQ